MFGAGEAAKRESKDLAAEIAARRTRGRIPIEEGQPPHDGRLYRAWSARDRGVVWWFPEEEQWGWVAEGRNFHPEKITHWAEFE